MKSSIILGLAGASVATGLLLGPTNIHPDHKHSWGENIGWLNWRDAENGASGVVVGQEFLSGYVWGENVGWINVGDGSGPYANTDDTNYGVNVDTNDDLGGYAWGENVGWLNFGWADAADPNRPRVDRVAYRLRGYAWGENIGWVNLDDSEHYVAYQGCAADDDCQDDDVCTWDRCENSTCDFAPNKYGDIDGNGYITLADLFCVLDGYAGDFTNCSFEQDDIHGTGTGSQPPCVPPAAAPCCPNGVITLSDLFAVLDAFGGEDPCCGP